MVKDPVCNMQVDEKTARYKSTYMGETYYSAVPCAKRNLTKTQNDSLGLSGKTGVVLKTGGE